MKQKMFVFEDGRGYSVVKLYTLVKAYTYSLLYMSYKLHTVEIRPKSTKFGLIYITTVIRNANIS